MQRNHIIKSELFKIKRDSLWNFAILGTAIFNGVLAAIWTLVYPTLGREGADGSGVLTGIVGLLTVTAVVMSLSLITILPFRAFMSDYNNSLLAMSVASGTSRAKYYFSKFAIVFVRVNLSFLLLVTLPTLMFVFTADNTDWTQIFGQNWGSIFIIAPFFQYLALIALIYMAVVLTKGSMMSILVAIGVNFAAGIVTTPLQFMVPVYGTDYVWDHAISLSTLFGIFGSLILLAIYLFFGWQVFKRQDLA